MYTGKNKISLFKIVSRHLILGLLILCLACGKEQPEVQVVKREGGKDYQLNTIQFVSPDTGFAVGGNRYSLGMFLKTTDGGQNWEEQEVLDKEVFDMHFFDSRRGLLSCYDGKLLRTTDGGQSWLLRQTHEWEPLHALHVVNDTLSFAVGGNGWAQGTIVRSGSWFSFWQEDTTTRELRTVHFTDARTGLAGGYGIILRTTDGGQSWDTTDARGDFFISMDFPTPQIGYVAGYNGSIHKTTDGGQSWERVRRGNTVSPVRTNLHRIRFYDHLIGYAVGTRGALLKTTDGGESWQKPARFTDMPLFGIYLTGPDAGWVCGGEGAIYQFME